MIHSNKTSPSTSKTNHKKSGTTKSRKHTKSTSSDNQDDVKRDNDSTEGQFAVFKSDTIECFAEQFLYSDDLKLSSEFCARLADDATYKLYELVHNIKTYAHPTGGVVTTDIVNDAIRSSDVPAVLGSSKPFYENIGFEKDTEPHYFVKDHIIDILNEIQKEIIFEQTSQLGLKVNYFQMQQDTALIQTFYTKISRGLLSGSTKTLKECLHTLRTVEQFEPILPNLLILCALVLKNYLQILTNDRNNSQMLNVTEIMYHRVLLILQALSNNRLIRTASVYNELYHVVQQLSQILFLHTDKNSSNKSTVYDYASCSIDIKREPEIINDEIKIECMESDFQTDINIIDENNSSMIMNVDDIIECKNVFNKDNEEKPIIVNSNVALYDIAIIEQLCNLLTAIGENWLCIRGKIIEILLSNLFCDIEDTKHLQCTELIARAISKLLYRFDTQAYIELDKWMFDVYGESSLFKKPIQGTYLDMQI